MFVTGYQILVVVVLATVAFNAHAKERIRFLDALVHRTDTMPRKGSLAHIPCSNDMAIAMNERGVEDLQRKEYKRRLKSILAPTTDEPEDDQREQNIAKVEVIVSKRRKRKNKRKTSRVKRGLMLRDTEYRWEKGVIPYDFKPNDCSAYEIKGIEYTMKIIQESTTIKFVKISSQTNISEEHNLTHSNYMEFLCSSAGGSCYSYLGMIGGGKQSIACCSSWSWPTCLHELGHAAGYGHEHQSYERGDYIRVNEHEIAEGSEGNFQMASSDSYNAHGFDLSSPMQYGFWAFYKDTYQTISYLDSETTYLNKETENFYYFLRDLQLEYSPDIEEKCPPRTCEHHPGFLSYERGVCKCRCIPGLDPDTNCTTIEPTDMSLRSLTWPNGAYGTFQPANGCAADFSGGKAIRRMYDVDDAFQSGDYNLNPPTSIYELNGNDVMEHRFCVHDASASSTLPWPRGSYCTLRVGGACGADFEGGWIDFGSGLESTDGTLPDGVASSTYYFCCRNDGVHNIPVTLPTNHSFVLLPENDFPGCQQVKGMTSTLEFSVHSSTPGAITTSGHLPHMSVDSSTGVTWLFFCYYSPINHDCGGFYYLNSSSPTAVITTPNYPSNYNNNQRCTWYIQASEFTDQITLKFNTFDIASTPSANGPRADDTVEVRKWRPGYPGQSFYGKAFNKTLVSDSNVMVLYFYSNDALTATGFNATISLLSTEDRCYGGRGELGKYDGTVNYTRFGEACLPWKEMRNCRHNPYAAEDLDDDLVENFCRNAGDGLRPWCYTSHSCDREYCDVCHIEGCVDEFSDCSDWTREVQFCNNHALECNNTCNVCDECYESGTLYSGNIYFTQQNDRCQPWTENSPQVLTSTYQDLEMFPDTNTSMLVRYCRGTTDYTPPWCYTVDGPRWDVCDIPVCLADGTRSGACTSVDADSDCADQLADYPDICDVDDIIRRKCARFCGLCEDEEQIIGGPDCGPPPTHANATYSPMKANYSTGESVVFVCDGIERAQTCSSSGLWKPKLILACGACSDGWVRMGEQCYRLVNEEMTHSAAVSNCSAQQATLAQVDTASRQNNIAEILNVYNLQESHRVWIGLTDVANSGDFRWADDTTLAYQHWAAREPDSLKGCYSTASGDHVLYDGFFDRTVSGATCIPWVGTSKEFNFNYSMHGNASAAGNSCQDPTNSGFLWCYTTESEYWDYCYVPQCHNVKPALGCIDTVTADYTGTWSKTFSGRTCQAWGSQEPHTHSYSYMAGESNYCRFAGYTVPWCFTTDSNTRWEECKMPDCNAPLNDCYNVSYDYLGQNNRTFTGQPCQVWDNSGPGTGTYAALFTGPENATEAGNNCRDPLEIGYLYCDVGGSELAECDSDHCSDLEDCVTIDGDGYWHDTYCQEDMALPLCVQPAGSLTVPCYDNNERCAELVEAHTSACQEKPMFAENSCRRTCGLCSDANPDQPNTATCDVGGTAVPVGSSYSSSCGSGQVLVSGHLSRVCLPNLTLTGDPPQCNDIGQVDTWVNSMEMRDRFYMQESNVIYFAKNGNMTIPKNGYVKAWTFYSTVDGIVSLLVLRKKAGKYKPIHQTVVYSSGSDRKRYIALPSDQQTFVKNGDVIGFRHESGFGDNLGGIPLDSCDDAISIHATSWYRSASGVNTDTHTIAQMIANGGRFSVTVHDFFDCAYASIDVLIGPQ